MDAMRQTNADYLKVMDFKTGRGIPMFQVQQNCQRFRCGIYNFHALNNLLNNF